jgi:hypothetical protein
MTHSGVDEPNRSFTYRDAGIIHHGQDSTNDRCRRRRPVDKAEFAINSDDIACSVGRKIRKCAGLQKLSAVCPNETVRKHTPVEL